jgi:hypothetical protein
MKRRDFFKGLLGLACLPFIPKVAEAKSVVILPPVTKTLTFPNYPVIPISQQSGEIFKLKIKYSHPPVAKIDKGIFMLDHWCNGYYEAVPLYSGDYLGPQSAKWVCTCTAYELMSQFIKQERDQQIINAIRG